MKRTLILAGLGLLLASSAWATSSFPVVHWVATGKNGGFTFQNTMGAPVKVSVELNDGEILLSTLNSN